jgi:hypothetical protein
MTKSELARAVLRLLNSSASLDPQTGIFSDVPAELQAEAELVRQHQGEVTEMIRYSEVLADRGTCAEIAELADKIDRILFEVRDKIIALVGDLDYPPFLFAGRLFEGPRGWRQQVRALELRELWELIMQLPLLVSVARHID